MLYCDSSHFEEELSNARHMFRGFTKDTVFSSFGTGVGFCKDMHVTSASITQNTSAKLRFICGQDALCVDGPLDVLQDSITANSKATAYLTFCRSREKSVENSFCAVIHPPDDLDYSIRCSRECSIQ